MSWKKRRLKNLLLYVVLDRETQGARDHIQVAQEAIKGGADIVQLRDKEASARELVDIGRRLREMTKKARALFIVNDRSDVAAECDADGVHLGQDDISIACARRILGEDRIIGKSTHSLEQALAACEEGADYISVGPVYKTPTKPDYEEVGLELIKEVKGNIKIPFIAIGGIDLTNIRGVLEAGATRIAVVRAVVAQDDIEEAARKLRDIIDDTARVSQK